MVASAEKDNVAEGGQISISCSVRPCFSYASYQSSIPIIKEIVIHNQSEVSLQNCVLEMQSAPSFLGKKIWNIDKINKDELFEIRDKQCKFDISYLSGLNEAERGVLHFRLLADGKEIAQTESEVRLLARDEWGGAADMALLLPCFVSPNDAAVAKILRLAAQRLEETGHSPALDGYQTKQPQRAYLLTSAVYSAVSGLGLYYAEPPISFEENGQKIRKNSAILANKLATCLDLSVLFAAALEAVGLYPVIIIQKHHAFVGCWLEKHNFPTVITADLMEVRKGLAAGELILFETTGVTNRPPMLWEQALKLGRQALDDKNREDFVAAIDIHYARGNGIMPLAAHESIAPEEKDGGEADYAPVPLPSDLSGIYTPLPYSSSEEKPATPQGRIEAWAHKLLDLTLRNRLLNFRSTKKAVPLLCADIQNLKEKLDSDKALKFVSLPHNNPQGERDAALFQDIHGKTLNEDFIKKSLTKNEIVSDLTKENLQAHLIDIYRQVKHDLAEGGTNTLFLVIGFLCWKKSPAEKVVYRAPLLLLPVSLERKSVSAPFYLKAHQDEMRFNTTLGQFLERDFALKISPVMSDAEELNIPQILGEVRALVRDTKGMEVVEDVALSIFSFSKFLMWKDLVERTDALRENRVVRYLIDRPEEEFKTEPSRIKNERELDYALNPQDIISVLPADSSQIAASVAAAAGQDFVLVGPPGTGKSQTIANMIAHCLAEGKTVLFVAEKTAALNVVYRRLAEVGLGDYCLELHSNKTDKLHFLGQMEKSWESKQNFSESDWVSVNEKLRIKRDLLNAYVCAVHKQYPNGLTPFRAFGVNISGKTRYAPRFSWGSSSAHDKESYQYLRELAHKLGRVFRNTTHKDYLHLLHHSDWSNRWQEAFLASAADTLERVQSVRQAFQKLREKLSFTQNEDVSLAQLQQFYRFAQNLAERSKWNRSILLDSDFAEMRKAVEALQDSLSRYQDAESSLSAKFAAEAVERLPLWDLEPQWRAASASFWPKSWLRRRRVKKTLQAYADSGVVNPEHDLSLLYKMQKSASEISANKIAEKFDAFSGVETDIKSVTGQLEDASQLRRSLYDLGAVAERVAAAVAPLLKEPDMHQSVFDIAGDFAVAVGALAQSVSRYEECSGAEGLLNSEETLLTLAEKMRELKNAGPMLRSWASWCDVRDKAENQGLKPLVEALEQGKVLPENTLAAFELGYSRWWSGLIVDEEPVLKQFQRFEHEYSIKNFREIDDKVRKHSSARVVMGLGQDLPQKDSAPPKSEFGFLRHQLGLKRPRQSIRQMIAAMPTAFPKLAPCVMMSPLSIAQYLPTEQSLFDTVIFDEASQITTWDAVGAIARAKQTIIVGDPKQLPPTNFFGRSTDDEYAENNAEKDLESILDEVRSAGLPVKDLRWHYRSRSESLIAFSNYHYYGNRLVTFPSPKTEDSAVSFIAVDGVYDRGKSRTNKAEAQAVADKAAELMREWLTYDEDSRPTLGVITFNVQQQQLIEDFLEKKRQDDPDLEWFFSEERTEPTIVKNLENIQGDERDFILFSITFANDAAGKRTLSFGALNREGGERRLNVAITRARRRLLVFSGTGSEHIDAEKTRFLGVKHLKIFLDFAKKGVNALAAPIEGSMGGYDSPFEEAVARELERLGWHLVPQVGISGFRIDIGVKHPDYAGDYLAGVECDGATYHSSATARDRDKVREQVLRGLGWNIIRIWSTSWWYDMQGEVAALDKELKALLEKSRSARQQKKMIASQSHKQSLSAEF